MELGIAAAVLCFVALRLLLRRRGVSWIALGLTSLVVGGAAWTAVRYAALPGLEEGVADRPIEVHPEGYVSSRTCEACHPSEYESWHASYHRTMTQVVTPQTVATDLDGVELEDNGQRYQIERRGDEFWVEKTVDGVRSEAKPIVTSTGSHSMQAYWMASGEERRLEMLPFHYLIGSDEWVPRRTAFLIPPDSAFYVADWSTGCIHCHTTRGQPRTKPGTVDTQVAEFGVSCEACHGPGAEHVRVNRNPLRRYRQHLSDDSEDSDDASETDPDIVNPRKLSRDRASEVCGRCHGYGDPGMADRPDWLWSGHSFEPGEELEPSKEILLLDAVPAAERARASTMFWRDGMVRGSGREFGALMESACFQRSDMSCLSCHALHRQPDDPRPMAEWTNDQLAPGMRGDAACSQCHPALVADVQAHSHHLPESAGSNCYNCHMPYTVYGLLKAIRSHEISNPSVQESVETGRPNACNGCHLDETLAWTAGHLEAWFEVPKPKLRAVQQTVAASLLWGLSGDAAQRALTAWSMGWEPAREASGEAWMAPLLAQLLEDPYPAVRYIARRSLGRLPGFEGFDYDFLGSESDWREAHERALALWSKGPAFKASQSTLVAGRGRVHRKLFARLLAARDNRPVIVAE